MIICKSEPRISFGTQQQPYLFLSYLKNPYCFCLKLKKKPQNTHFQVYENFEFYSKKIEKNDFPCLEIMSILLGKCKIRKSKLYSYRLLSHCAVQTYIKGGCHLGRKVLTHNSKSGLPRNKYVILRGSSDKIFFQNAHRTTGILKKRDNMNRVNDINKQYYYALSTLANQE